VCVTAPGFIDALVEASLTPDTEVVSFGDMLKVPGSRCSLAEARAGGGRVRFVYTPFDVLALAAENPGTTYVVAAVGFETTAPVYAALIEKILGRGLKNVRFLFALKTMPRALAMLCESEDIDGFLAPGHVASITGTRPFAALSEKYGKPFAVAGFEGIQILAALYALLRQLEKGEARTENLYPAAVKEAPQPAATEAVSRYFTEADTLWRGIGVIPGSGLRLKAEYAWLDAAASSAMVTAAAGAVGDSSGLPPGCRCRDVVLGRIDPVECPLYASACTPDAPVGPCMVSAEGCCANWYAFGAER
jgi:hydrogenase expression/formation protein HypD